MVAIYHPGVVTVVPHYDLGQPTNAVNVIHWQTAAVGLTVAQLTAIQTAFDNSWKVNWPVVGSSQAKYTGAWVIDNSSNTGAQVTNASFSFVSGSATGGPLGDQVASLISLKGSTRYRGGHARLYIPGPSQAMANNDGRTLTTSAIAGLDALWNGAVTAMSGVAGSAGGPLTPIIWHKKLSSSLNSIENVVGHTTQAILATQRRRIRKVSRHRRP